MTPYPLPVCRTAELVLSLWLQVQVKSSILECKSKSVLQISNKAAHSPGEVPAGYLTCLVGYLTYLAGYLACFRVCVCVCVWAGGGGGGVYDTSSTTSV